MKRLAWLIDGFWEANSHLGGAEKVEGGIGDDIRQVVSTIVKAMVADPTWINISTSMPFKKLKTVFT